MPFSPAECTRSVERPSTYQIDALIDWLRAYVAQSPDFAHPYQPRQFSPHLLSELGRHGILGALIPIQWGGLGLPEREGMRLIEQMAAMSIEIATFITLHYTSSLPYTHFACPSLRERILPDLAQGRILAALALTEPAAGSNARAMQTTVTPGMSKPYRINGQKTWISNARWATLLSCFARHENGQISAFAVPRDAPGLTIGRDIDTFGLKAMVQNPFTLEGVEVDEENFLGERGAGLDIADRALSVGRMATGAIAIGGMKRCIQLMERFATRRHINTGRLIDNALTQERLWDAHSAIVALQTLLDTLLEAREAGHILPTEAYMIIKVAASELLWQTIDNTLQLLGSRGYDEANGITTMLRDARFLRIGEGPSETLLMQLGAKAFHNDSQFHSFLHTLDTTAGTWLATLINEAQQRATAHDIELIYNRLGHVVIWHVLSSLMKQLEIPDIMAQRWIEQQLEEAARRLARYSTFSTPFNPAEWKKTIDSHDMTIGSLDKTWPIPQSTRDPFLQETFVSTSIPHPQRFLSCIDLATDISSREPAVLETWMAPSILDPTLVTALTHFAQKENTDLEYTLLAIFIAFVSRFSEQTQIDLVHIHVTPENTTSCGGLSVNLSTQTPIHTLLQQIANTFCAIGSDPAQVVYSRPQNGDEGRPLQPPLRFNGISIAFAFGHGNTLSNKPIDGVDLTLLCEIRHDGVYLGWRYNRALFLPDTITRRHANFETLLSSALQDPTVDFRLLPLLPAHERTLVTHGLNGPTTEPHYYQHTVHQLIEAHVDLTPDAIALQTPHDHLTYQQLDKLANQLAHYLHAYGLTPGDRVAVATSRSPMMVVSLLGTLKAGGQFVLLNSHHPTDRREWILEDTHSRFLITDRHTHWDTIPHTITHTLFIESDVSVLHAFDSTRPKTHTTPNTIAYIIYTSGSTGKPKGVMISHRAICNQMLARRDDLGLHTGERILQAAAPNFDIAILELLGPLVFGGCIVFADQHDFNWDPAHIKRLLREYAITVLQITPSQLTLLLDELHEHKENLTLRHVICGGESLSRSLQQRFFASGLPALYKFYGPTEGVIDTAYWRCDPEDTAPAAPIGYGIKNRYLYVLDEWMQPVPLGVPGELFIGGISLAEGYLNLPELTAERFLIDPFRNEPHARMYRTGDRVRHRHDGALIFLGRIDRQIKMNGVRIEPDEIEVALCEHPLVSECAVALRTMPNGEQRLVAYLGSPNNEELASHNLREFAQCLLPREMIPNAFIALKSLPKTSTGKVDFQNLPPVDWERVQVHAHLPMRTPFTDARQRDVAAIWSTLLNIHVDDASADFFALGGHSLLAIRFLSWVRDHYHVDLSINDFFDAPTLSAVASKLSAALPTTSTVPLVSPHAALPLSPSDTTLAPSCYLLEPAETQTQYNETLNTYLRCPVMVLGEPIHSMRTALSFPQESLWFLHTLGDNGAYNETEGIRLHGALDIHALHQSMQHIVQRHDILRTTFVTLDGIVQQLPHTSTPLHLPLLDLSHLPSHDRHYCMTYIAQQDTTLPFHFERGPLWRLRLIRLAPDEHVMLITIHHICGDGWSLGLLSQEFATLYQASVDGTVAPLPALQATYRDYSCWQHQTLVGTRLAEHLAYWQAQLAGLPPLLNLALDHPRPPVQDYKGAIHPHDLGHAFTERLRELAHRCHATLYMTSLSAFAILLHHYSRMHDFAIGSPSANRNQSQFEPILGFFANMLVMRANLTDDPSVETLISRFKKEVIEAHSHAELPFDKLVEAMHPIRDPSYHPIFQVVFSWQPGETLADMSLPHLTITPLELTTQCAKFDLTLIVSDSPKTGLRTRWNYNTALFDAETIEHMSQHFTLLLEQMVENPAQRISSLYLLAHAERQAMLTHWAAQTTYPPHATLHQVFQQQVIQRPTAIAIVADNQEITYAELDQRSNALAHHLRHLGVAPERLVGIFLQRSINTVVAILGTLKAGGGYVPIDPLYPTERITTILHDAQVVTLLSEQSLFDRLPSTDIPCVVLDRDWEWIASTPPVPGPNASPENVAYVIYTSGSTGKPKGVIISHYHVMRLFQASEAWFHFTSTDVWSVFHSFAFDFSVWELWGALLYGGRAVIVPYLTSRTPEAFYQFLREEQITILSQTPSAFQALSQAEERLGVTPDLALRFVIFGGEALDFNTLAPWFARHGDQQPRLVNMYGITETTVHTTYRPIGLADLHAKSRSMIGHPLPDLELLILNEQLHPVPVGVPGELFVGGAGVARGYLNRPELTSARFIPHPINPNRRLYRSGDLVRSHVNGDIEYLGRLDHQVQLRGFRIELEEIQLHLSEVPGVLKALVLLREDRIHDPRLVAYVVIDETGPSTETLYKHLQQTLPSYMLPSAILPIARFPLTPNGKIDRTALPKPIYPSKDTTPPRDLIEASLVDIWCEILHLESVGVYDNFFDVGGHSLLAIRLLSRITECLGKELSLSTLLQNPTIEGIARAMTSMGTDNTAAILLQPHGTLPPLFCIPGSGGMALAFRDLTRHLSSERPFIVLQRPGLDGLYDPIDTVENMATIGLEAIRQIQPQGPYYLAGHSFGAWVAYEIAWRLSASGETVALCAILDMPSPPQHPIGGKRDTEKQIATLLKIIEALYGRTQLIERDALRYPGKNRHTCLLN